MFEDEGRIKVYVTTFKTVIKNLSTIKECPVADLQEMVEEQFDGYNYDGEEELTGFENWPNLSQDGEYKLNVKINHEDAYEITLHTAIKGNKATITNVL